MFVVIVLYVNKSSTIALTSLSLSLSPILVLSTFVRELKTHKGNVMRFLFDMNKN